MRTAYLARIPSMLMLALLLQHAPATSADKSSADDALFSRIARDLDSAMPEYGEPLEDGIELVVGNDFWQPGSRYASGNNWLALSCSAQGCVLEPARLKVSAQAWKKNYSDEPKAGLNLSFKKASSMLTNRKDAPTNGEVIAWLHKAAGAPPWLAAGVVPTYYSTSMPLKQPSTAGTLETLVTLPSGGSATLVPMLLRLGSGERRTSDFFLQLRSGDRRQFLAGRLGVCSKKVATSYLLWAGDLDRDGKPDYLVGFVDAKGEVHLYLSGRAREGYLVGLGGKYDVPPSDEECDTKGWLE